MLINDVLKKNTIQNITSDYTLFECIGLPDTCGRNQISCIICNPHNKTYKEDDISFDKETKDEGGQAVVM